MPARPTQGEYEVSEYWLYFNWTLEGAADKYHIWNEPAHGLCAASPSGVCELDVKENELTVTGLTAGEGTTTHTFLQHLKLTIFYLWYTEGFLNAFLDCGLRASGVFSEPLSFFLQNTQLFPFFDSSSNN